MPAPTGPDVPAGRPPLSGRDSGAGTPSDPGPDGGVTAVGTPATTMVHDGERGSMYDRILVPTDGSDGVDRVLDEAVELAELTGATIHGLYVVDARDYSTLPEAKWLSIAEELESAGERALETVTERAEAAGVDVETDIDRGVPHEQILDTASETDADIVAMGTHGRSGLNRFLLGSVTEKVVRGADVPVLVVRIQNSD